MNDINEFLNSISTNFPLSYKKSAGVFNISNSGRRGEAKEFSLSYEAVEEALQTIKESLSNGENQFQKKYDETQWRLAASLFSNNTVKSFCGVQTKPFFELINKLVCFANNLEYKEGEIFLSQDSIDKTISCLNGISPLFPEKNVTIFCISKHNEIYGPKESVKNELAEILKNQKNSGESYIPQTFGFEYAEVLDHNNLSSIDIKDIFNKAGITSSQEVECSKGKAIFQKLLKQNIHYLPTLEIFKQQTISSPSPLSSSLQQISYGAPGTGKSYSIKKETEDYEKLGRVVRTTFHPDSDYSTFVGAYKPTTQMVQRYDVNLNPIMQEGKPVMEQVITYEFVPQAFLQAYVDAWKIRDPEFLVIEEINRGNCAQIFGDLFQLLDRNDEGYSDYAIRADKDLQKFLASEFAEVEIENPKVKSGEVLVLPNNLYIRATMNTSDQSLFPIDSAFKRRWDWKYVPIKNANENYYIEADNCYDWWSFVEKINKHIFEAINSEDKQLGYFFCRAKDKSISAETFVGKVIFYLWNDVFKDYGFDSEIFNDGDGKLSFDKFYDDNGEPNIETIQKFMENLGVDPIEESNGEEFDGQEETSDDANQKNWPERHKKRYEFWTEFLSYANKNDEFAKYFGGVKKANRDHWKNFYIKGALNYHFSILQQRRKKAVEAHVYIADSKETYRNFFIHKDEIEQEMGVQYEWKELPEKKASVIIESKNNIDFENKAEWPSLFDFFIDRLLRMKDVFPKYAE